MTTTIATPAINRTSITSLVQVLAIEDADVRYIGLLTLATLWGLKVDPKEQVAGAPLLIHQMAKVALEKDAQS